MHYTTLVSTDALAAHLGDWAVVDCRFDLANEQWGREQYRGRPTSPARSTPA